MAKTSTIVFRAVSACYLIMSSSTAFQLLPRSDSMFSASFLFQDQTKRLQMSTSPTPEDSVNALRDYMTKAHEAKLKAISETEAKKDIEIRALREELATLKATRVSSIELASSQSPVPDVSKEELLSKLTAYQKFMADYIVKSSEEKYRAVQEAETTVARKYEAKLLMFGAGKAMDANVLKEESSFEKRSANIVAAAKAGKSRWNASEVKKAESFVNGSKSPTLQSDQPKAKKAEPYNVSLPTTDSSNGVQEKAVVADSSKIPVEVTNADHGLRADGGVDGLTLAERVMLGSKANEKNGIASLETNGFPTEQAQLTIKKPSDGKLVGGSVNKSETILFDMRNERLKAAAKVGKNYRWADKEVQKAETDIEYKKLDSSNDLPAATLKVIPEVEEADKGLRADGGVSGPSLLERVNLGAAMLR